MGYYPAQAIMRELVSRIISISSVVKPWRSHPPRLAQPRAAAGWVPGPTLRFVRASVTVAAAVSLRCLGTRLRYCAAQWTGRWLCRPTHSNGIIAKLASFGLF
jgi:hypothetical protein